MSSYLFHYLFCCCLFFQVVTSVEVTLELINSTRHQIHRYLHTFQYPRILGHQNELIEKRALITLLNAMELYLIENEPITLWVYPKPFEHILVAAHIHPFLVHNTDGRGESEKYFVGPEAITDLGKEIVVYSAGVAGDPTFENSMSRLGTSVFGFDCTDEKRADYNFSFHQWCIGKSQSFEHNVYSSRVEGEKIFKSISQIKRELGHPRVNILKMDIEGFEWDIFQSEIIDCEDEADLPEQLLFELHTEGASRYFVPPHVVQFKRHHQVNELVFNLWLKGYRCVHIELNEGDSKCAEMAFLRYPTPTHLHSSSSSSRNLSTSSLLSSSSSSSSDTRGRRSNNMIRRSLRARDKHK